MNVKTQVEDELTIQLQKKKPTTLTKRSTTTNFRFRKV